MTDGSIDFESLPADPPVKIDDQIVVECEHSRCSNRTAVPTDIAATAATYDVTDWSIRMIPRDGRVVIEGATCHNHRVDKAIARLEHKQTETIKTIYRRSRETMRQVQES